ncbi:MAG: JAB domain-containing protein [Bacteroidia bacterium]|nr:JAB domain-containing protein [Bacteroidia bacterium]
MQTVTDKLMSGYQTGIAPFQNKTVYEKLASQYKILDKTEAKELAEYATLKAARQIIESGKSSGLDSKDQYRNLVKLYNIQPGITHRSSWSTIYQQYSTPIPISYAAGIWIGLDKLSSEEFAFEPSAGNGLLTVAANPKYVDVNEIDKFRKAILQDQHFSSVRNIDASISKKFKNSIGLYKAVISNPPFDKLEISKSFDGEDWKVLDHLMAAIALNQIKPEGRAALIVGGHTEYDEKGRIRAGKNRQFIGYLYKKYKVADIININGDLYRKQGTQFDIRLILIDGKQQNGNVEYPSLVKDSKNNQVNTFNELWDRIFGNMNRKSTNLLTLKLKLKAKAALALGNQKGIDGPTEIPEIELRYKRPLHDLPQVTSSREAAGILREHYNKNHLELKESMICMLLDTKMKVLGIAKVSEGSKHATVADPALILAIAAKSNASSVILSHNHPSGDPKPSQPDLEITKRIGGALKLIGLQLADHIIITPNNYYSFGDSGQSLGSIRMKGYPKINPKTFVVN